MFFLYSILLSIGFIVLLPRFAFDALFSGKYAGGLKQRLGFVPKFDAQGRPVVWVHCVSVGETNAARPLVMAIREEYPGFAIVVSTTTSTGQKLAQSVFADTADLVFYFPFDWRSTVRRTLRRISPAIVLLVETEIWFNFLRETSKSHAKLAIVNGRLSQRSFERFNYIPGFMNRVLSYLDVALMQENADATRIMSLGLQGSRVKVTGNIKFDHRLADVEDKLTEDLRLRFGITPDTPLIIAASTHSPEENWILEAFKEIWKSSPGALPRLMIAPRHLERFSNVADIIGKSGFTWARRSENESARDKSAEVILLDSIGELRSAFPLAEIVFVGGSLIPHGGQSIFEPAAAGRAVVTGPYTENFFAAVTEFLDKDAIVKLPELPDERIAKELAATFLTLLNDDQKRSDMGAMARNVVENNRGAVARTLEYLKPIFSGSSRDQ